MRKVVVQYDELDGSLYDRDGLCVGCWIDLKFEDLPEAPPQTSYDPLNKVKELRAMGLSISEIRELQEMGMI